MPRPGSAGQHNGGLVLLRLSTAKGGQSSQKLAQNEKAAGTARKAEVQPANDENQREYKSTRSGGFTTAEILEVGGKWVRLGLEFRL